MYPENDSWWKIIRDTIIIIIVVSSGTGVLLSGCIKVLEKFGHAPVDGAKMCCPCDGDAKPRDGY